MTGPGLIRPEAWLAGAALAAALALAVAWVATALAGPTAAAYQLLYLLEGSRAFQCL